MPGRRLVLLTGAAGRVATACREHWAGRYRLRLHDIREVEDLAEGEEPAGGDLAEMETALRACAGVDAVVHLAAVASPRADFYERLLDSNVKAVYNVFEAAARSGCVRVVFASSVNAVKGAGMEKGFVRSGAAARPGNVYGACKAFGEALLSYYCDVRGLTGVAIRFGAVEDPEGAGVRQVAQDSRYRRVLISRRDAAELTRCAIEAEGITFALVHGLSRSSENFLDISGARELLGYEPADDWDEIRRRPEPGR